MRLISKAKLKQYIKEINTDAVFDRTALEEINIFVEHIIKEVMEEAQKYRGFNSTVRVKSKFIKRAIKILGYEKQ